MNETNEKSNACAAKYRVAMIDGQHRWLSWEEGRAYIEAMQKTIPGVEHFLIDEKGEIARSVKEQCAELGRDPCLPDNGTLKDGDKLKCGFTLGDRARVHKPGQFFGRVGKITGENSYGVIVTFSDGWNTQVEPQQIELVGKSVSDPTPCPQVAVPNAGTIPLRQTTAPYMESEKIVPLFTLHSRSGNCELRGPRPIEETVAGRIHLCRPVNQSGIKSASDYVIRDCMGRECDDAGKPLAAESQAVPPRRFADGQRVTFRHTDGESGVVKSAECDHGHWTYWIESDQAGHHVSIAECDISAEASTLTFEKLLDLNAEMMGMESRGVKDALRDVRITLWTAIAEQTHDAGKADHILRCFDRIFIPVDPTAKPEQPPAP